MRVGSAPGWSSDPGAQVKNTVGLQCPVDCEEKAHFFFERNKEGLVLELTVSGLGVMRSNLVS